MSRPTRARWRRRAPALGIIAAGTLLVLAMAIPAVLSWDVHIKWFPPLHAEWMPRVGPGTVFALALAVLAVVFAPRVIGWPWPRLLLMAATGSAAWMIALATVDGWDGIGSILDHRYEYMNTAREVTDFGATLREYVERIPFAHEDNWPVHIAGHPPGALLFFVVLVRLGLSSGLQAGLAVIAVAATTVVAVLLTLRRLGAEDLARRAAPFLVVGPAAIWSAVSADAMFGAVAAWGLCALAYAATSRSAVGHALWGLLAGVALGYCVMMSYGLPLLGLLALAVLWLGGSWRPLLWAIAAALAVVGAFALAGFAWWEAFPVLSKRYWDGVASSRPAAYWMWGNLAALAFSAGLWAGAGIGAAVARSGRSPRASRAIHVVVVLTLAAAATILLADLSQMSKAEVERIWLPFVPWLLIGCALLPPRWRRVGLGVQASFALVVQHLLLTSW